jgi:hypothetical protein
MNYIEKTISRKCEGKALKRPSKREAAALLALYERNFFRRIWIVQEVMLARNIDVFCGGKCVNWGAINCLDEMLKASCFNGCSEEQIWKQNMLSSDASRIIRHRQTWENRSRKWKGHSFRDLFVTFHDMESTDILDKVYGLLGLRSKFSEKAGKIIYADYSKSPKEVYIDVLRATQAEGDAEFVGKLREALGLKQTHYTTKSLSNLFFINTESKAAVVASLVRKKKAKSVWVTEIKAQLDEMDEEINKHES